MKYLLFCLFCALPDVGALIAAFVHRKDLKNAKVISTLGYVYRMKEAGLTNETMPLSDEDVERLKRRHSVIVGLVIMPIAFVLLYGGGAAIVGAVGWFINIVVVDPMRDRRFRHKMEV